ncbi:MAG: GTP-binding protein, partial [Sandaracinaceae bacterium]|nr:GTP-binding protein [Sandaracinaceae bacterium]
MTLSNQVSRRRNFGIIAHVDAGKTTLTERILLVTGAIHRAGSVDGGSTTTDFDPEERKRGITIGAAAVTCAWQDHALTLVDTPGHADFTIEVERSLRVLDGAVVVLDGVAGVEPQTEGVWRQADRHRVARIVFVNKLDRAGADLDRALVALRERLGVRAIPIVLPIGSEGALEGIVDLIERRALVWTTSDRTGDARSFAERSIPVELEAEVERRRHALIEACADADERVIEAWLAGDVRPEDLRAAIRKATCESRFVPVLCGSAHRGVGVQPLLDAIVLCLPAPEQGEPLAEREPVEPGAA